MDRTMLAEHFMLYELTRSGVALENDLPNIPNQRAIDALTALAQQILEPLRRHFGPIVIGSAYRSVQVNLLVDGVPSSQHLRGEAADIVIGTPDRGRRLARFIRQNLDFDQLILEPINAKSPRWLHVSYTTRRPNRHQVVGTI